MEDTEILRKLVTNQNNLELLVNLIIDNARLSYDKKTLSIDNETVVMQVLKQLYPEKYIKKYNDLIESDKNDTKTI